MGAVLEVEVLPQLRQPVLVVACTGWVDAGEAGEQAAALVKEQLDGARVFARYDLSEHVDLGQTRPMVGLVDGVTRQITWPSLSFVAGQAGRDVVCCTGPEPALRWPSVVREIGDLVADLGVEMAVSLAGFPAVASHRRPFGVTTTATNHALAQEIGAVQIDYRGPIGFPTVLLHGLGTRGIPGVGLWAQVPHYVAGTASPSAVQALLRRLGEVAKVGLDLGSVDAEVDGYLAKVEEGLSERPDVAELVKAIEAQAGEEVSGDELAAEIERFLREQ